MDLRIAYVTSYDPRDISQWSGIGRYMADALRDDAIQLRFIGPLQKRREAVFRAKQLLYLALRRTYQIEREPIVVRGYGDQVERELARQPADVVFSPGTLPVAFLPGSVPAAFWTGSCFAGMAHFYPAFRRLPDEIVRKANVVEQAALNRVALAIYASEWAASSAIDHYDVDPRKIKVIPYGPNLAAPSEAAVERMVAARAGDRCRLLFVGVDWERKGGPVALQVAQELNAAGLEADLTLVGSRPPPHEVLPAYVKYVGFLDKAKPEDQQRLRALYAAAHFLILPSDADAFGIVFCEASAFGVPSLATRVGGVPSAVRDGVNGYLFPAAADPAEYVKCILEIFGDTRRYRALAKSSYAEYKQRLNWERAGRQVRELLRAIAT